MTWQRTPTSRQIRAIRDNQRERIRAQLIADGVAATVADHWIANWESRGEQPTTSAGWDRGYEWIVSELAGREAL